MTCILSMRSAPTDRSCTQLSARRGSNDPRLLRVLNKQRTAGTFDFCRNVEGPNFQLRWVILHNVVTSYYCDTCQTRVLTAAVAGVSLLVDALIAQQAVTVQKSVRVQSLVVPLIKLTAVRRHVDYVRCACNGINHDASLKIIRHLLEHINTDPGYSIVLKSYVKDNTI